MHEIDRRHVRVADVAQHFVPMLRGPFVGGDEAGRSAVGQRRGITGGQRAATGGPVEGRFQRREFFQRRIRTQDVVARNAAEPHHQIVEEASLVGGSQFVVRRHRPRVLRLAVDLPFLGHVLAVLAHRLAGARLAHARQFRLQFLEREPVGEARQLVHRGLGRSHRQQPAAEFLAIDDRHVGGGVGAAADADLDLTSGNLVGDGDDGVQRGAAGALQGDTRRERRQARRQRGFATDVPVAAVLEHRAHRHFAQLLSVQTEFLDHRAEGPDRHSEVADIGVGRVLAAEGNAGATQNGDGTTMQHQTPRGDLVRRHGRAADMER